MAVKLYEEFNISKYCGSSWEDSENMLPQDLNIRDASLPDKIGGIYFPRKTGGEIISEELSKPDLLFRLYQASAYFDELHMPVLYGLNRIVPRINPAADSRNKLKLVSAFANKFKAEAISGRLNEICKYVQGGE